MDGHDDWPKGPRYTSFHQLTTNLVGLQVVAKLYTASPERQFSNSIVCVNINRFLARFYDISNDPDTTST